MARIRNVKPEFFDDEGLGAVSLGARLCFIGLWTQADKAGRLEDRPARLKVRLFPFDAALDIVSLIDELVAEGCVVRYRVQGKAYLVIPKFSEHQYLSRREPDSTLPGPDQSDTGPRLVPDKAHPGTVDIGHRTKDRGQGTEDSAAEPAPLSTASVWDEWREQWHANPKRRPLPLTPVNGDLTKLAEAARRFPDPAHRRALLHAYFTTENKQILKNPFSVGWFLHWADKLAELLLVEDERHARDTSEWTCEHDPPCGARAQHLERLNIDAMKVRLKASAGHQATEAVA